MPAASTVNPAAHETGLDPRVAREAAHWLMRVHPAAEPTDKDHHACRQWRAAHAQHELAWQRAQQLDARFGVIPPALSHTVLDRRSPRARRSAIKKLALLLTLSPAALLAYRQMPVDAWRAEYKTATGERRSVQLADGSRVQMNTQSAFDTVFDTTQRLLVLHEGELLIATAADSARQARPFRVQTHHGMIRAIGTRFVVKRADAWSDVGVFEGAVEVQTSADAFRTRVISASQQLRFSSTGLNATESLDVHAADWQHGILHADHMTLAAFCDQLARYRRGWIRCDPAIKDLLISGSFQVDDTDRVLRAVVATLPVRVTFHTRYWATLHPA